jgi:voltage-gated sodium channel
MSTRDDSGLRPFVERQCSRIVDARWFNPFIVGVIALNAVVIGLETYPAINDPYGGTLNLLNAIFLGIFIVEISLRFGAYATHPADFFRSGWHIFDIVVIGAVFIPGVSGNAQLLRLVRLLRVVRIVSVLPDLRVVIAGLGRSVLPIASLFLLIIFVLYVFGIVGWMLYGDLLPEQWGDIGAAMITLFQVLTLEGWNTIATDAVAATNDWSWIYFIVFVLLAVFIFFNMLIGIMVNSLEEARDRHRQQEGDEGAVATSDANRETERKITAMRQALDDLEEDLRRRP